jgi:hypothetical protein
MTVVPQFIENGPDQLADYVASIGRGLIIFDGRLGSGKTYLARLVAQQLGYQRLDGDDFLLGNSQPFMTQLDFGKLAAAIDAGLLASPVLLLSTAFAHAVAEEIKRVPAAVVWVEDVSVATLDAARANYADDIFANEGTIGGVQRPSLYSQVEDYITSYRARFIADRVYLNAWG